jgi:hypothetical protein
MRFRPRWAKDPFRERTRTTYRLVHMTSSSSSVLAMGLHHAFRAHATSALNARRLHESSVGDARVVESALCVLVVSNAHLRLSSRRLDIRAWTSAAATPRASPRRIASARRRASVRHAASAASVDRSSPGNRASRADRAQPTLGRMRSVTSQLQNLPNTRVCHAKPCDPERDTGQVKAARLITRLRR